MLYNNGFVWKFIPWLKILVQTKKNHLLNYHFLLNFKEILDFYSTFTNKVYLESLQSLQKGIKQALK